MIYAYEGEGSIAGSLSSLSTVNSERDEQYDYLKEWGPKFYKLSNIYSHTTVERNVIGSNPTTTGNQQDEHIDYNNHQNQAFDINN